MRSQSSMNSAHSYSFDYSMTIPEDDEFFSSNFNNHQDGPSRNQMSTLSSPSVSISSLSSIGGVAAVSGQAVKHFRRSQTGTQLLNNRAPWSRYALRQISFDSSTSSLLSTTSSTAVLLPKQQETSTNNPEFISSKSTHSILGSPQRFNNDSNERPKSSTVATFEDKFVNLYDSLSSSDENLNNNNPNDEHKRCQSVWRGQSQSTTGKHPANIIKRSASAGRLNFVKNVEEEGKTSESAVEPPFFAHKILPTIWIGDIRAAECNELLSDGGSDHESRMIRRRVYVDFETDKHQKTIWPSRRPNIFDYMLPIPRREKITKKCLFMTMIEMFKIISKARRDGTQVLVYGQTINLPQFFSIAYLTVMFNKTPQVALELVASRSRYVFIPQTLITWLHDIHPFLERKQIKFGQMQGDIIFVENFEANRAYNKKYVIVRRDETAASTYQKHIKNAKKSADDLSPQSSGLPLPTQVPPRNKET